MKGLKWINTGTFLAMVTVNALAESLPLFGRTTGQISEAYPNLFTPAPVTFAIWGLIYLMMLAFTVYQLGVMDGGAQSTRIREKIGIWFSVSCGLNILWIFLWHGQLIGLSALCMILLLAVLTMIVNRLRDEEDSLLVKLTTKAGFSLYTGWIIAATIANISVYLTKIGWNGWGLPAEFWTVAVLLAGAMVAAAEVLAAGDRIAAIAVMWAYGGILIRHISPVYLGGSYPWIIAAAIISECLILAAVLFGRRILPCGQRTSAACRRQI